MRPISRFMMTCAAVLLMAAPAAAQATRTWVSGVGDDVNPCSRTAPCKTFAGAISKTATGGVISVLDPGGFGGVNITKSITIDGGGIEGSILGAGVNGVLINIATAGSEVTLRNLSMYGVGTGLNGVRVIGASVKVTIEGCEINGFNNGIDFNNVGKLQVYDTFIHQNQSFGAYVRLGRGSFDNVRIEDNNLDGLRVGAEGVVGIKRSVVSGHSNIGLSAAEAATAKLTIEDTLINHNAWGLGAANGATVWVNSSSIINSTTQGLWTDGASSLLSFGNNRMVNNPTPGAFTGTVSLQ